MSAGWWLAAACWAQWLLVVDNLRVFQAPPPAPSGPPPRVSVLVPARDEASRIGACVVAVLAQEGVTLELLVLDDRSADGTAAAAIAAAGADARLRVLPGAELPPGWAGKNHACHQLAEAATGDWLIFLDADVRLRPGAIAAAVAAADARGAALLSLFPAQETATPGERLMLPLLMFTLLAFLPLRLAASRPEPSLAAANGQWMVFSRVGYAASGGHVGCSDDLVEDMALARAIKAAGLRLVIADGSPWATCRMYTGFGELWRGFRKNLYPAFGGRPGPFLVGLTLLVATSVAPAALALSGLIAGRSDWWGPGLAGLAAGLAMRLSMARRLGHAAGWPSALLHPLAVALLAALALDSWRGWSRGGVSWKGRTYGGQGDEAPRPIA